MITVDDIKDFHLDSVSSVVLLETLEISHSLWPVPIRIVTNHPDGVAVTLENSQPAIFEFIPLMIQRGNTSDDLDQTLNITVGDLGEIVPPLIQKIRDASSDEKPQVIYRSFAFDAASMVLTKQTPIEIIRGLSVAKMNQDYQATTFEAATSGKNSVKTGRTYNFKEYPDLRGLI
jgi:hypothetical protein